MYLSQGGKYSKSMSLVFMLFLRPGVVSAVIHGPRYPTQWPLNLQWLDVFWIPASAIKDAEGMTPACSPARGAWVAVCVHGQLWSGHAICGMESHLGPQIKGELD